MASFTQEREIQFNHISTSKGLSQSSAIAIEQDKLGQIWVGTRDGLNKYDGNTFTVYRNSSEKNSISNNDILSILEDKDGLIWVGTYNGLNTYNPKKNLFTNYTHQKEKTSLSNNTIWTIKEMSNGEIWIGTSDGLSIFNKKTKTFTNVYKNKDKQNSLVGNHVLSILETKEKDIYIGTTKGFSKLISRRDTNFKFKNFKTIENSKNSVISVQDLIEDAAGNLLIASAENGVLKFTTFSNKLEVYVSNNKIHKNVRRLAFDAQNKLWIGTYEGLYILDKSQNLTTLKNEVSNDKSLSKNSIKSIFKDKKGAIWIGTYYGGLNIWDPANVNFINYTTNTFNTNLSYSVVSSIEKYTEEIIYLGTEGKGINILNIKENTIKYINQEKYRALTNNNIKSLLIDQNKLLWVGTVNSGINLFNINKNTFVNDQLNSNLKEYLKNVGVYEIKASQKKVLWIGTFGKGLVAYNTQKKTYTTFLHNSKDKNTITNNLIRAITIDSKNNVWVGTQVGLNRIANKEHITRYFYDSEIKSGDDISTIFEDSNQTIWVGTKAKGLYKLNGSSFEKIPLEIKNLPISYVHSILEDVAQNLWISTNKGILKYNPANGSTLLYNQKDGLISNEFNDNSSLKIGESQFFFGGPNGVTSFNTNTFNVNNYAPQVIITDFKIKNKSILVNDTATILENTIQYTNKLALSHEQGNFSIQFAIPNFLNPKNNSYKYRLRGLEDDWVYTSENTASYTIQNPGNYVFEVKGANSDGVWNTASTTLKIQVSPAPWRSWWAFLLYAILILTALYFLITIQQSKTKLKYKLDLEQLENEKNEETNKAKLEFFTNISHEFRTPLTLILGPLHQILEDYKGSSKMYKKLLVVENSANHLLQLINRLMDFRKLEKNLFKLEAAEGNIVKFLKEIFLSFSEYAKDGDYEYNFHTTQDEILVFYDRYKLERVFYNLISNAFRYTQKNGSINIRVKKEENNIIISIEDTGVGISDKNKENIFDRFFEVSSNNSPENNYNKGTGIGLSIAKNIVNLHKGKIIVQDNTQKLGSIFSVTLPLGKSHLLEDEILKDFKFSDDVSQYINQLKEPVILLEDEFKDTIKDNQKATILLVEDHKPLRKFMKSLLKEQYNILEAENGKIALKMAIKYIPNLIVSDVVMPVMVGTELCSEIKNDIKTSHIPIILLTSRSALIYKLEGLESGADDYLSKPFNVNEFKIRIKNLLNATNRLKDKFSGENGILSDEVILSSLDEKLYKKALDIIASNIANESFDIPFFCSELGVSRTMLFIKIKAWTNFTPNDFIQHFRMKSAAQLLEQGKLNISEISYKVGFKNPKYFSKCFLKKYGETPTQYANKFSDY